ncbi:MAG: hypothetical protein ACJ8R9_19440 [Steroidobacteraceae bacterium]
MIAVRWTKLNEQDRATYRIVSVFLDGRLRERATIDWALRLKPADAISQMAALDLLERTDRKALGEPWLSAWSLIQESWETPPLVDTAVATYGTRRKLRAGDRTGTVISEIVELVKPRLRVEPFSKFELQYRKPRARPRTASGLFSANLSSGDPIDQSVLDLASVEDRPFLTLLANALEAAVNSGLDIARRLGWDWERRRWGLGQLNRVYYVPVGAREGATNEPDQFHRGIASSVKLLHCVVARLAELSIPDALSYIRRWKLVDSPVHLRLWAAFARNPRIAPADEVGTWLLSLADRPFWNIHEFPEVAELRALRFRELNPAEQQPIVARLRKGPPRDLWPKKTEAIRVRDGRRYWSLRELRRLELGGATLSTEDKSWLDSHIASGAFAGLADMTDVDGGFPESAKASYVAPQPSKQFDLLEGADRLKALERALTSTRSGWDDDPARGAADWVRVPGNATQLIADFEAAADNGASAPHAWEQFGWAHAPTPNQGATADPPVIADVTRVLSLLTELAQDTIRVAVEGISHWLQTWRTQIAPLPETQLIWSKIWPVAVQATNAAQQPDEQVDLNTVLPAQTDQEHEEVDTLNSPVARLTDVFLAKCPQIQGSDRPFDQDASLRSMREALISASGRSGVIVRYRLIEHLPYFRRADPEWTETQLLAPLLSDNATALTLWQAVGRQTQFTDVLRIIGAPMAERTVDRRLGRETRQSLAFSLVVECLHALKDARQPALPYSRVQQTLRSLDDEVRAYAADAIRRFIEEISAQRTDGTTAPNREELFAASAKPFLEEVWPRERSLNTPAGSRAFAHLPAACGDAFAAAVAAVDRFLVPFECWSLIDYGLYGDEDGKAKLERIDTPEKAAALLQLLDRTIGTGAGSVIPHDLSEALQHVRQVAPRLQESPIFLRLAAAARR